MNKQDIETKLAHAFEQGFVPKEIKSYMNANRHVGRVYLVDQADSTRSVETGRDPDDNPIHKEEPIVRFGIGYVLMDNEGVKTTHVLIYDHHEIQKVLKELE